MDRTGDEFGVILVKLRVFAHTVNFAGGGENDPFIVLHAVADDAEVFLKVQLEHPQRVAGIFDRSGDGDQRQHDVTFADVVLDPFTVDGNIAFTEVESGTVEQMGDVIAAQVQTVNFVIAALEQSFADPAADLGSFPVKINADQHDLSAGIHVTPVIIAVLDLPKRGLLTLVELEFKDIDCLLDDYKLIIN